MKPASTGWLTLSITIGIEEVLASTASTACELGATIKIWGEGNKLSGTCGEQFGAALSIARLYVEIASSLPSQQA